MAENDGVEKYNDVSHSWSWRISPNIYTLGGCRERDRVFVVMEARLTVCVISRNSRDILVMIVENVQNLFILSHVTKNYI